MYTHPNEVYTNDPFLSIRPTLPDGPQRDARAALVPRDAKLANHKERDANNRGEAAS